MPHSKGIQVTSEPEKFPPLPFYTHRPPTTWRSDMMQSIKRWLTMCCSSRAAHKTSDAAVWKLEEGSDKIDEDCEPLIEGESLSNTTGWETAKVTFPKHAAASFMMTGTSKAMREANYVL
ncbi:uncharacterized protein TrAFT101_005863 [Trichoderma asperellum]|uniref:Uncharacterized protein n=1 Tax=Trichoderma asperellum (strain ATCC 204424 / CBS 433.97 / NBRC 101777) TaxID=1042311 RepID=A0A2T3Z7B0_TRIA4|nr:hypothetical protein M441DRAFT_58181 [Trichoderma asperellum CBS 433.97]PTB40697.1 hypothetical protein M441DRAFT_58181 [Trichoderma asperellum CBS 433.97]UKZ90863.1 hypothetical protein TrAFT101_005863 [Trichoderma asperellum]